MVADPPSGLPRARAALAAPQVADEREALEGWLDYFRAQVILALDGLPPEALRRRVPETGPSLTGIVKHLTELERTWLVERWGERGGRAGVRLQLRRRLRRGVPRHRPRGPRRARRRLPGGLRAAAGTPLAGAESLDDAVRDDRRGHIELRWILLHLITETARRAGQAQALREVLLAAEEIRGSGRVFPPTVPPPPM